MGEAAAILTDLNDLAAPEDIKDSGDFLGGFNPFESDIYDFTIKLAYITVSAGGAKCLNLTLVDNNKKELKTQLWFTSSKAKGGLTYYVNQRTQEKNFLPGYVLFRHLALLTTTKEPNALVLETRQIKLYSREAKAEVPTSVAMCVDMLGKPVSAGVIKRKVDRTKDSGSTDEHGNKIYLPTGETRFENEIDKFFRTKDRKTVTEILAKAEQGEFAGKWLEKWKGQIDDRTSKNNGTAGAPAAAGAGNTSAPAANAEIGNLFA